MMINARTFLVSANGGHLDCISRDGELLFQIKVPAGRVRASHYLDLIPDGATLEVADGLAAFQPRSAVGIQPYGKGSHECGANPDYQPTSADRASREMRLMLNQVRAEQRTLEARLRAFQSVQRIPTAPAVEPAPALEAREGGPVVE